MKAAGAGKSASAAILSRMSTAPFFLIRVILSLLGFEGIARRSAAITKMSRVQVHDLATVILAVALLLMLTLQPGSVVVGGANNPSRPLQTRRVPKKVSRARARIDYSHFSHTTHVTQKQLTCDECHKFPTSNWKEVRKGDAAFADVAEFPEHQSCLNCHRPQFFARQRPAPAICANCHANATPRDTTRFLFDSLADTSDSTKPRREIVSEFAINFPHDKHVDIVEARLVPAREPRQRWVAISWQQEAKPAQPSDTKSCPVCHQTYLPQGDSDDEYLTKPPKTLGENFWLKKGTFKTSPNSHAVCFTCHNQESELAPLPQDCNACHKLAATTGPADFDPQLTRKMGIADSYTLTAWRSRQSAGAFRHEAHDMSCTKCHNAEATDTVDVRSLKVPIKSCGGGEGCHVTATTDDGGILNYELDQRKANDKFVCVKCHLAFGAKPVPASHSDSIVKSRPNE